MKEKAHLHYYTLRTLSKAMKNAGFKIVNKSHKGIFGIGKISNIHSKIIGTKNVEDTYKKNRNLANAYRWVCQKLMISDCIQVIARK